MPLLSACSILEPSKWPNRSGTIILTFDDGPTVPGSEELLAVLRKRQVKAVFCCIGTNVDHHPEMVAEAYRDGHVLANHTYEHTPWCLLDGGDLRQQIESTDQAIARAVGQPSFRTAYFRPPYGLITPAVAGVTGRLDKKIAYLTFFINDANADKKSCGQAMEKIKRELLRHRGGAIVMHQMRYVPGGAGKQPSKAWLPAAVDDLIVWARGQGMDFGLYGQGPCAAGDK